MIPVSDFIRANPELVRHRKTVTDAVNAVRAEVLDDFAAKLAEAINLGDAKLNSGQRDEKFSVTEGLWITPMSESGLWGHSFKIRLKIWADKLHVGMKVSGGCNKQKPDTQRLLHLMNRLMSEYAKQSLTHEPCTNNMEWPTGWDVPIPLNDDVIADWLGRGMDSEIERVSDSIFSHIQLLERAYTAASAQIQGAATPDSNHFNINTP